MFEIVTWIVSLACCYVTVMAACKGKAKQNNEMPANWPCEWDGGLIPYVFDYYSTNLKRLISIVHKGLKFIENESCLTFHESNPIKMAQANNFTYLFFTYSAVLEECCAPFFDNDAKRRLVLITPICRSRAEVAHATLHALGLTHGRTYGANFDRDEVDAVMFPEECYLKMEYDNLNF